MRVDRSERSGAENPLTRDGDAKAIAAALDRYTAAVEAKDLAKLKDVWPTLTDEQQKKIRAGFDLTRLHKVQLQVKDIQIAGSSAVVNCRRRDQIVTADASSFQREGKATFRLVKKLESWTIESME